jgi:hypothetical protein
MATGTGTGTGGGRVRVMTGLRVRLLPVSLPDGEATGEEVCVDDQGGCCPPPEEVPMWYCMLPPEGG